MAGIGIRLSRFFDRKTIGMNVVGYAYSVNSTIMPVLVVMAFLLLMAQTLGVSTVGYRDRELFSCTVLYIFIFGLLTVSPINACLSRYMSDVIFEERYDDIRPCFSVGLFIEACLTAVLGVPFCLWECLVGGVGPLYVFTGYFGYASLVLVFYTMIFLSICKDYGKISLFFLVGMVIAYGLAALLIHLGASGRMHCILIGFTVGFAITASLETAQVVRYFPANSRRYRPFLSYLRRYRSLVLGNFLYTLGLFVHNFVFWHAADAMVVADTFVCNQPYDMATCLAMFTSLSTSTIFISLIEMHFSGRYRGYFNAVIGGSLAQIKKAKLRMFSQLDDEIVRISQVQFIISLVVFLLFCSFAPRLGVTNLEMDIYRLLAAAYFIAFLMYANIVMLYYYSDNAGLLMTTATFCVLTLVVSLWSRTLDPAWYGVGMWAGALAGWVVSYARLRWVERHLDQIVFCQGDLIERGAGKPPSPVVYARRQTEEKVPAVPRRRVLVVMNTMGRAGAETSLLSLLRALSARPDLEVSLYVLTGQGELMTRVPQGVHLLNGESYSRESVYSPRGRRQLASTVALSTLRHASGLRNLGYLVANGIAMRRAGAVDHGKLLWRVVSDGAPRVDEGAPYDLAIAYIEGGSTYFVADHVRARRKVAFVHISFDRPELQRRLDAGCYGAFDRVFAVSESTRESFCACYPELADKARVMDNILDVAEVRRRSALPGGFRDDYEGRRILTVARLMPTKAIDIAIDALALLREGGVEARWYVLGEGELRPELEQRVRRLGLQGEFVFLGSSDNPYPFMAQCDVYVHATRVEGRSIAMREAKALGCAVVASDIPGNRDSVEDGVDGILCPLTPQGVAEAVRRVLCDPDLAARLGGTARERADLELDPDLDEILRLAGVVDQAGRGRDEGGDRQ